MLCNQQKCSCKKKKASSPARVLGQFLLMVASRLKGKSRSWSLVPSALPFSIKKRFQTERQMLGTERVKRQQ